MTNITVVLMSRDVSIKNVSVGLFVLHCPQVAKAGTPNKSSAMAIQLMRVLILFNYFNTVVGINYYFMECYFFPH